MKLSSWLADAVHANRFEADALESAIPTRKEAMVVELEDGYVPVGTVVPSTSELERLLAHWLAESNRPTVGEVGAFGGSPVLIVRLAADEFVLNRDTKRAAVRTFLAAAREANGADHLPWRVTTNARGAVNRVTYRPDDAPIPGWYAYIRGVAEPRELQ